MNSMQQEAVQDIERQSMRKRSLTERVSYAFNYFLALSDTAPLLWLRGILWILLSGWILFLMFLIAAIGMVCSIVFLPFAWPCLRLAVFSLWPLSHHLVEKTPQRGTVFYENPQNLYTKAANFFWLFFFGWSFFLMNLLLSLLQFLSIIGIPNGILHIQLAVETLFPFGKTIERKEPHPFPEKQMLPPDPIAQQLESPPNISQMSSTQDVIPTAYPPIAAKEGIPRERVNTAEY